MAKRQGFSATMHTRPVTLVRKEDKTAICLCGDLLKVSDVVEFEGFEYQVSEIQSNSEDWDSVAGEIPLIQIAIAAQIHESQQAGTVDSL